MQFGESRGSFGAPCVNAVLPIPHFHVEIDLSVPDFCLSVKLSLARDIFLIVQVELENLAVVGASSPFVRFQSSPVSNSLS
jgi:hypothetical protein